MPKETKISDGDMIYFLHQPKRRAILKLLEKNGEMTQRAIARKLNLYDEHTRFHIDKMIQAGVLDVRYVKGDHQGGTDKLVRIADRAMKLIRQLREIE